VILTAVTTIQTNSSNEYKPIQTNHYTLPLHSASLYRPIVATKTNLYKPSAIRCYHCHTILPTACALCLAVLVRHGNGIEQYQVSMAGRTTQEQATKMSQLAGQALQAWKVKGHPGWSVDTMDSHHLCRLDQQQVYACASLQTIYLSVVLCPRCNCMPRGGRCMCCLSVSLSLCLSVCLSVCLSA